MSLSPRRHQLPVRPPRVHTSNTRLHCCILSFTTRSCPWHRVENSGTQDASILLHSGLHCLLIGAWSNIKMTSYHHRKSHCRDETILWLSYLHNGIGKMASLCWIRAQCFVAVLCNKVELNAAKTSMQATWMTNTWNQDSDETTELLLSIFVFWPVLSPNSLAIYIWICYVFLSRPARIYSQQ